MNRLSFELPIGVKYQGVHHKQIELLKTNGVSEKVCTAKYPEKPYTWMGQVISVATKRIGDIEIGQKARREYLDDETVTIPPIVKAIPLAEVNTLLVEIHRRVWQSKMKDQEVSCRYCMREVVMDIDLDRLEFDEESQAEILAEKDWDQIICNLPDGFEFVSPTYYNSSKKGYEEYNGLVFNRFIFRTPTLQEGLNNEKYVDDQIVFWRRIAFDCLVAVQKISEEGHLEVEMPVEVARLYGMKLYNEILSSADLKKIRHDLRESIPTLPFTYKEECPCERKKEIPVVMEATNFFSEQL
jgi:hypothetical protein